jgi:hypothetical protein
MSEDRLREALRNIKRATNWWWVCAGQVSRDDMDDALRQVREELDRVNDLVFPGSSSEKPLQPMKNDF